MTDFDHTAQATLDTLRAGDMPAGGFSHRAHLLVAWYLVRTRPFFDACIELRAVLTAATRAMGVPEKYDDDLTRRWMLRVAACVDAGPDFDAFLAHNPDLMVSA